jgi:tetratricopeptide (TPR) repeat protein
VLVAESGLSREDDRACRLLETLAAKSRLGNIVPVVLDLSVSRNRATAARFHVTNTPVLLGLSPRGLIVTRDERAFTSDLVLNRIGEVAQRGPELDGKLAVLETTVGKDGNDAAAQLELADFLLAQENAREAIPHLEVVAHNEAADLELRVHAWVELVRAHFWIMEVEKGRHEANALIAILGPKTGAACAGANFVLGLQDANAKRVAMAQKEFGAAIAAAPESVYAKQAAEALAKLPGEAR